MPRSRPHKVETRMNDEELKIYQKLVEKSKLSKQEYNLNCLLNKKIVVVDGIVDLALQIRKIGVNINQIVHLANSVQEVSDDKVNELDIHVKEVWNLLNDFVKSVKK